MLKHTHTYIFTYTNLLKWYSQTYSLSIPAPYFFLQFGTVGTKFLPPMALSVGK